MIKPLIKGSYSSRKQELYVSKDDPFLKGIGLTTPPDLE